MGESVNGMECLPTGEYESILSVVGESSCFLPGLASLLLRKVWRPILLCPIGPAPAKKVKLACTTRMAALPLQRTAKMSLQEQISQLIEVLDFLSDPNPQVRRIALANLLSAITPFSQGPRSGG